METGAQVNTGSKEWYVSQNSDITGAFDFDAKNNWAVVCECIKKALQGIDPTEVKAITATGFRHGMFCIDKTGNEIFACFNMDTRAGEQIDHLNSSGLSKQIYQIAGDWPGVHALPRLLWIKDKAPAIYEKIDKVILASDWAVYRLCGVSAVEPGDASSTVIMDISTRQWSSEIISLCNLRRDIFPQIVDSGTILGTISKTIAEETGFSPGTPVTVGVADTQAALVGVGSHGTGSSAIVAGTWWLDCCILDKPYKDDQMRMRISCHSEPGQWICEGVGTLVGMATRWFRDAFCDEEKRLAQEQRIDAYAILDKKTLDVPAGSYGLQVLFSDLANQKYWKMAPASFIGWDILNTSNSHKGVFFKAILENAAYQVYGEYQNIKEITGLSSESVLLAGGAAYSKVWGQIIADVLGKPVRIPVVKEGTAIGAAMYAAVGVGIFKNSAEAISSLVREEGVFEPNIRNHEKYLNEFRRWRELYRIGLDLVEQGLARSMWQSGGTLSKGQIDNPWKL
jgi:autoinducer 2 (AI-2) kinase